MMNYKFLLFKVDTVLVNMLHEATGESVTEIMANIYEATNTITSSSLKTTRASRLNKRCKFFYKKKYPIQINCMMPYYFRHYENLVDKTIEINVEVRFPSTKYHYLNVEMMKKLADQKFEQSVGLRENIEIDIEKPNSMKIELPRNLKGVL